MVQAIRIAIFLFFTCQLWAVCDVNFHRHHAFNCAPLSYGARGKFGEHSFRKKLEFLLAIAPRNTYNSNSCSPNFLHALFKNYTICPSFQINLCFWETVHLPFPKPKVHSFPETYFHPSFL